MLNLISIGLRGAVLELNNMLTFKAVELYMPILYLPSAYQKILCKLYHWIPINPRFQKKLWEKDFTQINKVTLKPVINEQLKLKNKELTQQKIQKCGNYA